jgi:hypothetical protein
MVLELTGFFLGTAIALFISILAWGNFIKQPREDLLKLEEKYIESLGIKKTQILPLIRPYSTHTFKQQMNAVLDLWSSKKAKGEDAKLSNEIRTLHKLREKLEVQYAFRYLGTIFLILISFILGVLSSIYGEISWNIYKTEISIVNNWMLFSIFIIIVFLMLVNSLMIYFKENTFAKTLFETTDRTGN